MKEIVYPDGEKREVGDYELHVQCPWRLIHENVIAVGSYDYGIDMDENLDPLVASQSNQFVQDRWNVLFESMPLHALIVNDLIIDHLGGIKIFFTSGTCLELFPAASHRSECWRLFRSDANLIYVVGRCSKSLKFVVHGSEKWI